MPRPSKPVRLWLQAERRSGDGTLLEHEVWCILDGRKKKRTGCRAGERNAAERKLEDYLATRRQAPRVGKRHPSQILVADVLNIYLADVVDKHADPDKTKGRINNLLDHFGLSCLSEINGQSCRAYAATRSADAAARRELEDLRAAINHHRREGLCAEIVGVWLPQKSVARERWLTRSEAARLVWAAWRYREVQKGSATGRRSRRHVAKFILVALYTGTRSAAICGAALGPAEGSGWIDLDQGVFYRRARGARETKKRQPPARLPGRLLAHLRRWKGKAQAFAVEFNGKPVGTIRKAFSRVARDAGLGEDVTPHTLRHTAATWLMLEGVDPWEAAGYLGMTVETLVRTYGHHHPDHQEAARMAFDRPGKIPERNSGTDRVSSSPKRKNIVGFAR